MKTPNAVINNCFHTPVQVTLNNATDILSFALDCELQHLIIWNRPCGGLPMAPLDPVEQKVYGTILQLTGIK